MPRKTLGLAAITLALTFNTAFSLLAARFDYPDILRQPPAEVLRAFAAGGSGLIALWYAFALSALALIPFALTVPFASAHWQTRPALALASAMTGALAGFAQGMGLLRWVFAIPGLAATLADPAATEAQRAAAETAFAVLNQWGGMAIGEHMGQMLTVGWLTTTLALRRGDRTRMARAETAAACLALAGMGIGLAEGPAMMLGHTLPLLGLASVAGYLGLTLWLVILGARLVVSPADQRSDTLPFRPLPV
ncbi:DUF4386 family protein [Fuscibacter oryzae]|uniref:DUF4386 family protein n=1 Tax=Fuscibacter oryzae TaxID=2803939 RepID=A0A8J7MVS6_9RHOB|nr:DUF4386 family protein [Fuscibacter oryzae]MBL4928739.1 DUF4386 family protein [Fuscibacter oryzae]